MVLPLSQTEYSKWMEAVAQAHTTIDFYGNWACPPWIIKRCGFENVREDLQMRFGKQYDLRHAVYNRSGTMGEKNYYILEKKKDE